MSYLSCLPQVGARVRGAAAVREEMRRGSRNAAVALLAGRQPMLRASTGEVVAATAVPQHGPETGKPPVVPRVIKNRLSELLSRRKHSTPASAPATQAKAPGFSRECVVPSSWRKGE